MSKILEYIISLLQKSFEKQPFYLCSGDYVVTAGLIPRVISPLFSACRLLDSTETNPWRTKKYMNRDMEEKGIVLRELRCRIAAELPAPELPDCRRSFSRSPAAV
ncbi:unnamed protein product [Boreogadus saida]